MIQPNLQTNDSPCPSALVLFPALIGTLVWVWALLVSFPQH
jgi:hypothetical protein